MPVKDFNNQSTINKHSVNLQPELKQLLTALKTTDWFREKYPDFTLTSSFRPIGEKTDLGFDTQWGLWNNWKKGNGYKAANPKTGSAHTIKPAYAFDFKTSKNNDKCFYDIKAVAKSSNIELAPMINGDPIHIQLASYKIKKEAGQLPFHGDGSDFTTVGDTVNNSTFGNLCFLAESTFYDLSKIKKIKVSKINSISDYMFKFIRNHEGAGHLTAYVDGATKDGAPLYSIGVGVQINKANFPNGHNYKNVDVNNPSLAKITEKEEEELFKKVLANNVSVLKNKFKDQNEEIYQHEFDGLFDLLYAGGPDTELLVDLQNSSSGLSGIRNSVPGRMNLYNKTKILDKKTNEYVLTYVESIQRRRYAASIIFKYGIYPTGLGWNLKDNNPLALSDNYRKLMSALLKGDIYPDNYAEVSAKELPKNTNPKYIMPLNENNPFNAFVRLGRSSFTGNENSRFFKKNITMLDVLKEAEYRAPGSYFDVLEDGLFATLFFGRPNYYIDRGDVMYQKKRLEIDAYSYLNTLKQTTDGGVNFYDPNIKSNTNKIKSLIIKSRPFFDTGLGLDVADSKKVTPSISINKEKAYEKATKVVFAVTGKNLIANNLIVNTNTCNAVTIDYNPSILQKLKDTNDFAKIVSKVTICAFPSIEDFEDRIKERVFEDDNIRTLSQAVEVAQSCLQRELEKYYDGSVIIKFDPDIRYRTEVVLFDTINKVYGSFLVREFEHKLDARGMYTIIKPMLKTEQVSMSAGMIRNKWNQFWSDGGSGEASIEAIKKFRADFNASFKKNVKFDEQNCNTAIDPSVFDTLCNLYSNKNPITFGDYAIKHSSALNEESANVSTVDENRVMRSSYGIIPFKAYPLVKEGQLLIPDLDLFRLGKEDWLTRFSRWSRKFGAKFHDFFSINKKDQFNVNIWQAIGNSFRERMKVNRMNGEGYYDTISKNGVFNLTTGAVNSDVYNNIKDTLLKQNTNKSTYILTKDSDFINFGFLNCRILRKEDLSTRGKNICENIIKNFDVFSATEIAASSLTEAKEMYNLMLKYLPGFSKSQHIHLTRELGLVTGNDTNAKGGRRDEYTFVFAKEGINVSTETHLLDNLNVLIDDVKKNSSGKNSFDIYATIIAVGGTKIATLHNIYEPYTYKGKLIHDLSESTEAPITNTVKRKEIIEKLLKYCSNKNVNYILGDFNTTIYNDGDHYLGSLDPEFTLGLTNIDSYNADNLSFTHNRNFVSLLPPNAKTTVAADGLNKPYDRILVKKSLVDDLEAFGTFNNVLTGDYREYLKNYSDHIPIYITFRR